MNVKALSMKKAIGEIHLQNNKKNQTIKNQKSEQE